MYLRVPTNIHIPKYGHINFTCAIMAYNMRVFVPFLVVSMEAINVVLVREPNSHESPIYFISKS